MKKNILFLIIQFLLLTAYVTDPFYDEVEVPFWLTYLAITFLLAGIAVIIFGVLNLNEKIGKKSRKLKNTFVLFRGIYKYVRHPIYAGMLIVLMAVAWFMGSWFKVGITVILGVIFYFKSSLEEQQLIKQYLQYKDYKERTGRFFPKRKNIDSR